MIPLVALLFQTVQAPAESTLAAERPVRVWLDTSSPLTRGAPVRVYLRANEDGHLVVLRKTTDGRIQVLFPGNPADDPFVRAGTYEIRAAGDREAFVVAEPDGTGWVLAALSPSTPRFDEFVRAASWNPDALVPSWGGADPEGALTDIVQRMLGDGYFSYDLATYMVLPARPALPGPYADQDAASPYAPYATCLGCTFVGFPLIGDAAPFECDGFFAACFGARRFHHDGSSCRRQSPCAGGGAAIALALAGGKGVAAPPGSSSPRFAMPRRAIPSPSRPIEPRSRAPAIVLRPGRPARQVQPATPAIGVRSRPVAARAAGTPINQVRLTLSPSARDGAAPPPPAAGVAHVGSALIAAPRSVAEQPAARSAVAMWQGGGERERAPRAAVREAGAPSAAASTPRATSRVEAPAPGRMQALALPAALWHGAAARAATVAGSGRRR
ncbi:MAG TPA: DUF4384 domain-containing protein [Gemmatimonadales bacterium]|nr:DUF4384 domain-containing protein [Gemmatimonadales bacterium]